jgi:predicted anti-sigma-YlaC factor YlaD
LYARLFLIYGGAVLLLLGIVGYLGVFNDQSSAFWLDSGENVAHTFLGIVALAAVFVPGLNTALRPYYRAIVALVGVLALFFAVYGFLNASGAEPNTFGVANLENPSDNLLHLVVGIVALVAAWMPSAEPRMAGG